MTSSKELDRRSFLKATIVAGGALVFGMSLPTRSRAEERFDLPGNPAADFHPNAFIKIAPSGLVTVVVGQSEMGQGVLTSLPMIVADELEVDWANVTFEQGPPGKEFINPEIGGQITGGSSSVKAFIGPLRNAAASAREMLVAAAAKKWNVAPETCRAKEGVVYHPTSRQTVKYGDLLADAANITPPPNPKLKDPKDFKYIGKRIKRLDSPSKVNGTGVFGIDVTVPGMLFATVLRSPVFHGKVASVDDTAAKAVKGVRAVIAQEDRVGVVADNYWAAKKGRDAA